MEADYGSANDSKQPVFEIEYLRRKVLSLKKHFLAIGIVDFEKDTVTCKGDQKPYNQSYHICPGEPFLPEQEGFICQF